MSREEIEGLLAFHRKQAELNKGKEHAAKQRRMFHEKTMKSLAILMGRQNYKED